MPASAPPSLEEILQMTRLEFGDRERLACELSKIFSEQGWDPQKSSLEEWREVAVLYMFRVLGEDLSGSGLH